jgi:single-strand DNA-binding protein
MFIDVVAWDRLGEICNQYLKKGMSTLIEGRLAIRKYESKEGEKRTAVEVVASDMQMLDSKRMSNGEGGGSYGGGARAAAPAGAGFDEAGMDDEIPF